ncbi:DUF5688 family protein [Bilifractor sp. LCP19S3_H10]|uniref:DUF5688 family protein n=1 Tax=Bilifractor sp. LCP19S3_H10 TaxID=3438736 RepID=UPI003F9306C8
MSTEVTSLNSFMVSSNPMKLKKQILAFVQPVLSNSVKELSYLQSGRIVRRWNNLTVTFSVPLDQADADPQASLVITKNLLITSGISEDELYEAAIQNIDSVCTIRTMSDTLSDLGGVAVDDVPPIYVISNKSRVRGASMILSDRVLDELHEKLGNRFAILPSSIHEVLATPVQKGDEAYTRELLNMVCEINSTQVAMEDRLADCVYIVNGNDIAVIQ